MVHECIMVCKMKICMSQVILCEIFQLISLFPEKIIIIDPMFSKKSLTKPERPWADLRTNTVYPIPFLVRRYNGDQLNHVIPKVDIIFRELIILVDNLI